MEWIRSYLNVKPNTFINLTINVIPRYYRCYLLHLWLNGYKVWSFSKNLKSHVHLTETMVLQFQVWSKFVSQRIPDNALNKALTAIKLLLLDTMSNIGEKLISLYRVLGLIDNCTCFFQTLSILHQCQRISSKINLANINLFKVNSRNTIKRYEICSKSTLKTPERRQLRRSCAFITEQQNNGSFPWKNLHKISNCVFLNQIRCSYISST